MNVLRIGSLHLGLACILSLALISGCSSTSGTSTGSGSNTSPQDSVDPDNPDDTGADDLTDLEQTAIVVAGNAPGATALAIDVVQNSTGDLSTDDEEPRAAGALLAGATVGTCPEVATEGSVRDQGLRLTVDFGEEPCTALAVDEEFTLVCSGSAGGTFATLNQSVSLEFNSIRCNEQELDGTVDLSYELLSPGVLLQGDWDLTWYPGVEAIGTVGNGTASYVPVTGGCCDVTSIATFDGNVTNDGLEWSIAMADVLVSLEQYFSFIPYSGSITVDGPDIRAITITFNENSPATGEVSISIEDGRTISTDLYELEQWADIILGE